MSGTRKAAIAVVVAVALKDARSSDTDVCYMLLQLVVSGQARY